MAEEIKFFGFNNRTPEFTLPAESRQYLTRYNIYIPGSSVLTLDEIKSMDKDLFPWPLVAKSNSTMGMMKSWDDLMDFVDGVRDSDIISFSLPPQGSRLDLYKNVCVYVGIDFICVHDTVTDMAAVLNVTNQKLWSRAMLPKHLVMRLSWGEYGIYLEDTFDLGDARLSPLWKNAVHNLSDNMEAFRQGYMIGFANKDVCDDSKLINHITPDSLVGDPYTFGIIIGAKNGNTLSKCFINGVISKSSFLAMKVTNGDATIQDTLGKINLHNQIISGDTTDLCNRICKYMNPNCSIIIPNTFVVCGEGGNYCSVQCLDNATTSRTSFEEATKSLIKIVKGYNYTYNKENVSVGIIDIPSENEEIKVESIWKSNIAQFRLIASTAFEATIRLQIKDCELSHRIKTNSDTMSIITLNKSGLYEWDMYFAKSDLSDIELWVSKVLRLSFHKNSAYQGSSQKYHTLEYRSELGFCAEDGTLIIPKEYFYRYMIKNGHITKDMAPIINN